MRLQSASWLTPTCGSITSFPHDVVVQWRLSFYAMHARRRWICCMRRHRPKTCSICISSEHKAWYRREHGSLSQNAAMAATSLAWDCLSVLSQLATPVPCDLSDIWMANRQRELHSDYEDDLIIAAAIRAQADLLVTNDAKTLFTRTRRSNERRKRKKLSNNAQIALNLTGRIIVSECPQAGPRQPVPTG